MNWKSLITPNDRVGREVVYAIIGCWITVWLVYWTLFRPVIFPSPLDVLNAIPSLWTEQGLGQELLSSLQVNLEALALSTLIALPLAYLSRTPVIQPLAVGASKLRFLSPAVFFLLLLFVAPSGHWLKVLMLTTGMAFFLLTTMLGIVSELESYRLDDARTLRMDEWKVTWYVVVRGSFHSALDAIRDNAAMGWAMLMMVEGIVRSEGGVGVLLIDMQKHMLFAEVYAVAGAVIVVGLLQDIALGAVRSWACPYAEMATR